MTTPDEPLVTIGERYVLVELLDGDEDREVWRGHDDLASRQVVVTRFLTTDDAWLTAFDRRARQLEALSAPGVATALAHDSSDDPPWFAAAYVEGDTAASIASNPGLSVDDALAVIGQTAMALAAAHGAGVGHGRLDSGRIQVRPDGSVALIGFAMDRMASPRDDLPALARLARHLLDDAGADAPDITSFLGLLEAGDWTDPADIGRTALALAAAQRAGSEPATKVTAAEADDDEDSKPTLRPNRPWYDEAERKRVRNRLIALGAIVVIGGGILLRIFTAGAGETAVPGVVGIPYVEALHEVNQAGLRGNETVTTGRPGEEGTVIAQDPVAGQQAKVGSVVRLTVAQIGPG
jgi:hypothetical protein